MAESSGRVVSIDALRGFDMFWIVGGDGIVRALARAQHGPVTDALRVQFSHDWFGFRFYDLIFPLFVFLLGMSVVFSLRKTLAQGDGKIPYARIFRRFLILFLLGALCDKGISDMSRESPFSGVLQRMAWCYLFSSMLYCHLKLRGLIVTFVAIMTGYWALASFVPAPGEDAVYFEDGRHIVTWFDHKFLPFKEEGQYSDPEGMLSTLPAVCTALLGIFAGLAFRNQRLTDLDRVKYFAGAGVAMLIAGFLWSYQMPIIKWLWTPSYVLVAGGYSCLLVSLFHFVVDIRGYRRWAQSFVWIGVNPLAIYVGTEFINFEDLSQRFTGGPVETLLHPYGKMFTVAVGLVFVVLFARFLYRRQIFLRA